ncbi:MAG: hypothetical protein KGJ60_10125 [Verrucomicrobiota bacterium]|nr:hypothetical protein [Verrucomicrobiota bacterium]
MKKLFYVTMALGLLGIALLSGCQQQSSTTSETPATNAPETKAPAQ